MTLRARLATAQGDPEVGQERIVVYHEDGRREEVRLHDYERLYALPGVYEQIVSEDLGCRSPAVLAGMLGEALDSLHRERAAARVLDIAAGNGISGEALVAAGMVPVLGTDIVPSARAAALRDRPGLYGEYLTADLTALTDAERERLRGLNANALTCVAPVGDRRGQVPGAAFAAAASLLDHDAVTVHMHDLADPAPDVVDEGFWATWLGPDADATRLAHRRYLHRLTVTGAPYEMEAAVWRIVRPPRAGD